MSEISDALKRAKQAQRQQPPNVPSTPPLSPHDPPPGGGGLGWLFLIVIILIVACVFIVLAFGKKQSSTPNLTAMAPTQTVQMVAPVEPVAPSTNIVAPPKSAPPVLKLQGILSVGTPQAIVNGQTVYVGDKVTGFRVKAIASNYVVFTAPDGTEKKLVLNH